MFAIIETGGKQYKVAKGDKLEFEKIDGADGADVTFQEVLLVSDGKTVKIGKPTVEGAVVKGKVLNQMRAEKIIIIKKEPKKRFQRKQGHRQDLTVVEITEIKA